MVTRVDKKPIVYGTTFVRVARSAAVQGDKPLLTDIIRKSKGCNIPKVSARELIDDVDDISYTFYLTGVDDKYADMFMYTDEYDNDEAVQYARQCILRGRSANHTRKMAALAEITAKVQRKIFASVNTIYYGTEAVYQLYNSALCNALFTTLKPPNYVDWAKQTANSVCVLQAPYLFIHPTAVAKMTTGIANDITDDSMHAWALYKKLETVTIRLGSRKTLLAHAYYSGSSKRLFDPSENIEDDFEIPLTGFAECHANAKMYLINGIRYIILGETCFALSSDDAVNISTMAQCYYRTALYFSASNGYSVTVARQSLSIIKDMVAHCCKLINASKQFANFIRAVHILAQGDFNDAYEQSDGIDLGWKERSDNYHKEASELDMNAHAIHKRILKLATSGMDKLNVGFLYHALIGDEMWADDLKHKVQTMKLKVRDADAAEWSRFISFCRSYMVCRFMMVHKRKPKVAGDIALMNSVWANNCVKGRFMMPPQSDWGKVWISGEFSWTTFANYWHLEAQDVSYVMKDAKGVTDGKYRTAKYSASELIMAMLYGQVLDPLTNSTPDTARDRILSGGTISEVVLTTAPKAENAKPSWKKRVTFAADCEFRKMQAEYDRNCRKVMSFVRGPSLGVDQCMLEKQFADIAAATSLGISGAICSHDISAWSESMDRGRKFEFEQVLCDMLTSPNMTNIKNDWEKIRAVVSKGGIKDVCDIPNSSFQGFDGSSSTILHSMILIYCIDTARRAGIMGAEVKANMATLIDDCVALMKGLVSIKSANSFWVHLKSMYLKLGFEVDDLKSIYSSIKAIYLSRRFLCGGEVPSDLKVFIKAHVSYEDPLRCSVDVPSDIFGATRGACDANGDAWFIYYTSVVSSLIEICHNSPFLKDMPPDAAAVFALAPSVENGWNFPSIIDWTTNDVTDKRSHFNAILETAACHACSSLEFQRNIVVYSDTTARAVYAIKSQAWRMVSHSNIFTNPFDAIREGPLKPDMLRRNAVQDLLSEIVVAQPWKSLLSWNMSHTTAKVRELLIASGPLHAPTLSALVNCMPDNYRLSMIGKAIGSQSVMDMLPRGARTTLKRRVIRCANNFFEYAYNIYKHAKEKYTASDFSVLTYNERASMEREEFYTVNGVTMTDHTFPDPVATFTHSSRVTNSMISPNHISIRIWDKSYRTATRVSQLICDKGIYVPRRSGRVWEITSEYAKGWDSVSQRIAMGMAILARAKADGHDISALQIYFIRSWNELSDITEEDIRLISIHGAIKRLDSNPGASVHPITISRNILRGFNNNLKTALDVIAVKAEELTGHTSHLHDLLAHDTSMRAVTALHYINYQYLGIADATLQFNMAVRPACVIPECADRMTTGSVYDMVCIEIMDSRDDYGLLQACPELVSAIAIPTMNSSWVNMINALIDGRFDDCEQMKRDATKVPLDELLEELSMAEAHYTSSVIFAEEPARRSSYIPDDKFKYSVAPTEEPSRMEGDGYTLAVNTIPVKYTKALTFHQPDHVSAAVAIKSVIWSRLKEKSATKLAKILYNDIDCDYSIVSHCGKNDFWRGVVVEVARLKKGKYLSEMVMSGFRSLGVPDIHVAASNSIDDVTHAVASYFGAHYEKVVKIISQEVLSIAGRSKEDYMRPLLERVITNNPAITNAKMRKEHMAQIKKHNITDLTTRIECIEMSSRVEHTDGSLSTYDGISHRGDLKACIINKHARLVELRCRRYTFQSTDIHENGQAEVNMQTLGQYIFRAANSVAKRLELKEFDEDLQPSEIDEILPFMELANKYYCASLKDKQSGWDPASGFLGIRMAMSTIDVDSEHTLNTRFAVTASEVAPRIHKRIMITEKCEPSDAFPGLCFDDDTEYIGADFGGEALSFEELMAYVPGRANMLEIEAWKALFTLVFCRNYEACEVNVAIGTSLPDEPTISDIREAHLEDFDDGKLFHSFPCITSDYITCGSQFNPAWLEMQEADAYLEDEDDHARLGYFF